MDRPVQLKLELYFPLADTVDTHTAARIAQVKEVTIRRWCVEDRVLAHRPGGRWRVDKQSLYGLISRSRNSGPRGCDPLSK